MVVYTALEATLRLYLAGPDEAMRRVPALGRLLERPDALRRRAQALARRLRQLEAFDVTVAECRSQAGSGSLPARDYDSWGVRVAPCDGSVDNLARDLRLGEPSIVTRVQDGALILDLRTLTADDTRQLATRLTEVAKRT